MTKKSLNKIEREKVKMYIKETARDLYGPWFLGGLCVIAGIALKSCDKTDKSWDYQKTPTIIEAIYGEPPLFAYSAKNIKYFDDKI